jgi:phosphoribosyl 1,2-cyclic phosphodiesterase/ActR/RegA family two-component response regulator
MRIKFWGTRGSIPTPGPKTARYGGNTSCIELRTDNGALFILDCGTGLRGLGRALMEGPQPVVGNILLSHTHWDHTQGFAFFKPLFEKGNQFTIFAASGVDRSLSEVLSGQMDYLYFPLTLDELEASIVFKEVGEETFNVGDVQVRTQFLNHTILTLGFRITAGGRSIVYATDHEPFSPNLYRAGVENPSLSDIIHAGDRRHVEFLAGADLVIHDAQYTNAEYTQKRNWGHSTTEYVIDVAMAAGAKQVVLTHHDPDHDDDLIESLEASYQARVRALGSNLRITAAAEGMEIWLPESADKMPKDATSQPVSTRSGQARILVADDDLGMVHFIQAVLGKDKYEILAAENGEEALEVTLRERPNLILLDVMMPKLNGYEVAQQLRAMPEFQDIPIIMFTARASEEDIMRSFELGVNDYIGKPVAPSLLRSRVRRWLMSSDQKNEE